MAETTDGLVEPAEAANEPIGVVDDVEAHGLREVAAAAGIGAAVIGAGGVALASAQTPVPKTPGIVQQVTDDAQAMASHAAGGAGQLAGDAAQDSATLAGHTARDAQQLTDPTVTAAKSAVTNATGLAATTAKAATTILNAAAQSAASTATTTAGAAERAATTTAAKAAEVATTTADREVAGAKSEVRAVAQTAIQVVGVAEDIVNRGWNLDLSIVGTGAHTDGTVLMPTGTVRIVDASGHTLATTKIKSGKASLALHALGATDKVTIQYGGDQNFAGASIHYQLPSGLT